MKRATVLVCAALLGSIGACAMEEQGILKFEYDKNDQFVFNSCITMKRWSESSPGLLEHRSPRDKRSMQKSVCKKIEGTKGTATSRIPHLDAGKQKKKNT